jgi:hypothetical protein
MVPTQTAIMNESNDEHAIHGIIVNDQANEMGEVRNAETEVENETSREEAMDMVEDMQREMEELAQLQEQWGSPSYIGRHQINEPVEESGPVRPPSENTPLCQLY